MILFLDFDGVVHPEPCFTKDKEFQSLPLIEAVLREFPTVEVVISSAWRLDWFIDLWPPAEGECVIALRKHFSDDIQPRVVGATPDFRYCHPNRLPEGLDAFIRQFECEAWLRENRPPWTPWLAVDDRAWWFKPFCKNLLEVSDPTVGFTQSHAVELRTRLQKLRNA